MPPQIRIALVTGGGSGIGLATARLLLDRGWRVAIAGRDAGKLARAAAGFSERAAVMTVPTDVGDAAAATAMIDRVVDQFGGLGLLVNNAGVAPLLPIERTTPRVIEEVFRVNALGPAYAIHAAWPVFRRQGEGCVVNVSTMGTRDPYPGFFAYAAAKAAVNLMARSCANEGAAIGVRAFAVAPGAVETAMLRAIIPPERLPPGACLSPEDVARVIVECAEGEREGENGGTIYLSAGL